MAITTLGADNPYLARYGSVPVSADLAAQLAQMQMNGAMVGQDPFNGVQVPNEGDSLLEFLANLHFSGQSQWANDLAEMNGIPRQDFNAVVSQIDDVTGPKSGWRQYTRDLFDMYANNPLLGVATGLAAALPSSAGVLSGSVGATGGGAGSLGSTTGSFINNAGELVVTGAAPAAGGLGAGLGAGLGGAAAAPAVGDALSRVPTDVGDVMTVTAPQPTGLGLGQGIGLGVGGAALAGAALSGGSAAAVPQGPPEPSQGPPESTSGGGAAAGAGAGIGAGAGLGGLGLPDWLTLAGLAGSALQGNQDQQSSSTNTPPAYLQPYLTEAAGAAQQRYQQGNYVAPVQQSAIDYTGKVLNGDYLNSNPYLDATFNKAAGAVTNQVQSNFGRSGRDVRGPDAAGVAGDLYSNLATQIYGGNYQAERDRQTALVPQANQLGAVTNPGQGLDDYIARLRNLGGSYGTTSSRVPTQNNLWAGLAGLGLALQPGG